MTEVLTMIFQYLLLIFLVVCALAVARTRDLLGAVIIFASYSLVMAILWQQLEAPDVAITEAAIGAGVTSLLFIVVISKTRRME
jgi:energy-converting hydrogenase B subunit D